MNGILFPILFISGVFFPVEGDAFLGQVGDVFPVRHFVNAVFAAFDPRIAHGMAHGWTWDDLAVVAIWGVGGRGRGRALLPLGPPPQVAPRWPADP